MLEEKKFTPRLKYYHILLLAVLLCPIIIINSNLVNKKRLENKLNEEAKEKFERILIGRKLDEFPEDTEKVCKKGSDDQKEYYKTGDGSNIGIKDGAISSEDRPDYINDLIDIVKSSSSDSGDIDVTEKLTSYIKHLIPVIFFLAVTVLSIPGWIICCSCCCGDCCCCCCLKKSICKLPFFIITYACYGIVVVLSIYGLSQSNSIFVGLADTECSLLKFVGDVIYGENKENTPKWGGIENIKNKLDQISGHFQTIKSTTLSQLTSKKEEIKPLEEGFRSVLKDRSDEIQTKKSDNNYYGYDGATLDLAFDFGTLITSSIGNIPLDNNSFVGEWFREYIDDYTVAYIIMEGVVQGFKKLIYGENNNPEEGIIPTLTEIQGPIDKIKGSIDNVKDQISSIIINYSDVIDEYGKLGFKIVFSLLTVFVAAVAAIMFILCFCSGKKCSSCCLFRCGFRIILHILWNILALLMILTFLIGSIFLLVGTVGNDLVSVVSYVVSSENLSKGEDEIALLGEAANTLTVCLNGDGDIAQQIGMGEDQEELLENLKKNKTFIEDLKNKFEDIKEQNKAYNNYNKQLTDRADYSTLDFGFKESKEQYKYNLKDALNEINKVNNFEELDFHCPTNNKLGCNEALNTNTPKKCYDLKDCQNNLIQDRYSDSSNNDLKNSATTYGPIIKAIISAQSKANTNEVYGIKYAIDKSNEEYIKFLIKEIEGLGDFRDSIAGLTDPFDDWVDKDSKFLSFLNCKFMGTNIKVVLKFLEKSLGGHFKTVAICLVISGFSLAIAIIFTILLMSILKENAGK